jgi:asparagine N-glycosylation enzyme membrane subunit Stt3
MSLRGVGLVLLLLAALIAIAYFWVEINPAREYGFGGGVLHGFFGVQNLILFCFTEREVWAPTNTGRGYTAGFYVGLFVLPFLIRNTIRAILYVLKN